MTLPNLDKFLVNLRSYNYSDKTVYNYERDLKVFEHWLVKEARKAFKSLKRRDIEQYKAYSSV